jgi:hypothetical protein
LTIVFPRPKAKPSVRHTPAPTLAGVQLEHRRVLDARLAATTRDA